MRFNVRTQAAAFVVTLLAVGHCQSAFADDNFVGKMKGTELITQDLGGRATFLFNFRGTVNGKQRRGFGFVGMNHTSLPNNLNESAVILSGDGTLYVGFRSYKINQVTGTIRVNPDGTFLWFFPLQFIVEVDLKINETSHHFSGVLRHDTLPFSIAGDIQ